MKTVIRNGHVVTAVDSYTADILVEGSTVALIGKDLEKIAGALDKTIDATGKLVIPGGIDPHTHMDLPFGGTSSSDDFETGTRAAAMGGTTTIVDFAVQYRGQSLNQALDIWVSKAQGKAAIDYVVHLSCYDALKEVQVARDLGLPASAETCPQYLFRDYSYYEQEGFEGAKSVMTPPLRDKSNQEQLWKGLRGNDLQVISTDHCPFCFKEQKELGRSDFSKIPNGGPGVEHRMSLIYDGGVVQGRINLNRFVDLTSTAAAKIFGLFPKKGTIAVGSDADIVIFDPSKEQTISAKTHHMRVDYSAYEGRRVRGTVETVLSRGNIVVEHGEFKGKRGDGQFLRRGTA